jgi:hypothetical protein
MQINSLKLSAHRRFITDLSHTRLSVPLGVVRRTLDLGPVMRARSDAARPVPWTVIFAKAWALVAETTPELRRSYVKLPWPQLSQAQASVASIMIERDWAGEPGLFPARLKDPAARPLIDLAADLDRARSAPTRSIRHFAVIMRLSRWPWPVRRALWFLAHNVGIWRVAYFGTFGISVLGHLGATIDVPVSPLTSFVSYGPFRPDGTVETIIAFDHRVMDGALVATALTRLEEVLNGAIVQELEQLAARV